jgi:hypothetical protein
MASGLIFHHHPGKTILHTLDPRVKLPGYLALSLIGIAGGKVTLVILAGCIGFGYTLGHSHPGSYSEAEHLSGYWSAHCSFSVLSLLGWKAGCWKRSVWSFSCSSVTYFSL